MFIRSKQKNLITPLLYLYNCTIGTRSRATSHKVFVIFIHTSNTHLNFKKNSCRINWLLSTLIISLIYAWVIHTNLILNWDIVALLVAPMVRTIRNKSRATFEIASRWLDITIYPILFHISFFLNCYSCSNSQNPLHWINFKNQSWWIIGFMVLFSHLKGISIYLCPW